MVTLDTLRPKAAKRSACTDYRNGYLDNANATRSHSIVCSALSNVTRNIQDVSRS
ncbi:MAG: hypothetical protein F6K28_59005 [Microcoleus sp. SIO2G3]|nr:hypothetical protein [Microcoleus sp. SIO2G3]